MAQPHHNGVSFRGRGRVLDLFPGLALCRPHPEISICLCGVLITCKEALDVWLPFPSCSRPGYLNAGVVICSPPSALPCVKKHPNHAPIISVIAVTGREQVPPRHSGGTTERLGSKCSCQAPSWSLESSFSKGRGPRTGSAQHPEQLR